MSFFVQVPRAIAVVESMTALVFADLALQQLARVASSAVLELPHGVTHGTEYRNLAMIPFQTIGVIPCVTAVTNTTDVYVPAAALGTIIRECNIADLTASSHSTRNINYAAMR